MNDTGLSCSVKSRPGEAQEGGITSGFGLGYSLAVVLPAFYAHYQAGLEKIMPFEYTALPLLVIGAILIIVGAAWGPETRDVDFSEEVQEAGETAGRPKPPPERRPTARPVALRPGGQGRMVRPELFLSEKESAPV